MHVQVAHITHTFCTHDTHITHLTHTHSTHKKKYIIHTWWDSVSKIFISKTLFHTCMFATGYL